MQAGQEEQVSLPCNFPAPLGKSDDEKEKNDEKDFMERRPTHTPVKKIKKR